MTENVHPSIRRAAERTADLFHLPTCGVDFVARDISVPIMESGGAICEVNSNPSLDVHHEVESGLARDGTDALLDMLFRKHSPSYPVIAVLREPGETEIETALSETFAAQGLSVGLLTEHREEERSLPRAHRARLHAARLEALEIDSKIDIAIIAQSERDVVEIGIGLPRVDLAILPKNPLTRKARKACRALMRLEKRQLNTSNDPKFADLVLDVAQNAAGNRKKSGSSPADMSIITAARPVPAGQDKLVGAGTYRIAFTGDIGFGEQYLHHPRATDLNEILTGEGYVTGMEKALPLIRDADFVIGNLEVPLAKRPASSLQGRKKHLGWCDPTRTVEALLASGFQAVSLGNNHMLDCGANGLMSTLDWLDRAGISAFGAGPEIEAARRPLIHRIATDTGTTTLAIYGAFEFRTRYEKKYHWYATESLSGVAPIDTDALAASIRSVRNRFENTIVVAYPHWGTDYEDVTDSQRETAEKMVAAGVDVIIGHGTHSAQTVEMVGGKPVVFGLGNFVWNTPGQYRKRGLPGYSTVAHLVLGSQEVGGSALRLYPMMVDNQITKFRSRPCEGDEFDDAVARISERLTTAPTVHEHLDSRYAEIPISNLQL